MKRRTTLSQTMFVLAPEYAPGWQDLTNKERHVLLMRRMQATPASRAELADHYGVHEQHIAVTERNALTALYDWANED
jgi:DNA-directed RNA polymerase sigma subunit (sigma70/sigma32)